MNNMDNNQEDRWTTTSKIDEQHGPQLGR